MKTLLWMAVCSSLAGAATTAYVPVCCNRNSTVSVISTAQNRAFGSFAAGPGSYAVAFPNPTTAWVTNSGNNTISVVALPSGRIRKTIQLNLTPWLIQASPDGSKVYVVTGMFTGSLQHFSANLQQFDAATFAVTGKVSLPNDGLMNPGLAVAPDGSRVYATFDSATVVVYDVASGTTAATWQTTRALTWIATGTLTLSPDGTRLYTAGQVLTVIDAATGTVVGTVNPPGAPFSFSFVGSAITADGSTLYASYAAQIGVGAGLAAIDTASFAVTNSAPLGVELLQPVLAKDGSKLYVLDSEDSLLYVVNPGTLTPAASIALEGPVSAIALNFNGSALAIPNASTASAAAVDTATFATIATIPVSGTGNPEIGLFGTTNATAPANGSRIYVGGVESNSISAVNPAAKKVARTYTAGGQSPSVTGATFPGIMVTPDGKQIYPVYSDFQTQMTVIDTATGAVDGITCPGFYCWVTNTAALPDSSRVYLAGFYEGVENNPPFFFVVDTATKAIVASPKIEGGVMAVSPTGTFLYIAKSSGLAIFDTTQNQLTGSIPVTGVAAMAFSPDGSKLYAATGSALETVDVASGQITSSVSLGAITPLAVAVTPDGTQVWVTPAKSTSVLVVDPAAGTVRTVNLGLTVAGVAFGAQ